MVRWSAKRPTGSAIAASKLCATVCAEHLTASLEGAIDYIEGANSARRGWGRADVSVGGRYGRDA